MKSSPLLPARAVAAHLRISIPALYRWIRLGLFPAGIKYGPNTTRWPAEVVDKWLADKAASSHSNA
jgi:prophage regulatory protein